MTPQELKVLQDKAFAVSKSKAIKGTPFYDAAVIRHFDDTYLKPAFEKNHRKSADEINRVIGEKKLTKLEDLIALGDSVSTAHGGKFIKPKDYITNPEDYAMYKESKDRQNKVTKSDFTGKGTEEDRYNYGPRAYTDRAKITETYKAPSEHWDLDVEHTYNPAKRDVESSPINLTLGEKFNPRVFKGIPNAIKTSTPAQPILPSVDITRRKGTDNTMPKLTNGINNAQPRQGITADQYGSAATGAAQLAGGIVEATDTQKNGKKSMGGAALTGAASGAAIGSTVGPWGTLIGGVVGGAAGAISSTMANKKIDAKMEEQKLKAAQVASMAHFQPLKNTQAPMYSKGTAGAVNNKPVEVEKDEVILRKGTDGSFTKVADFKGGKTHEQGGEPYLLRAGDVIFPGKKRELINGYIAKNDAVSIDKERQKLPKEVGTKAKEGVNYMKPKDAKITSLLPMPDSRAISLTANPEGTITPTPTTKKSNWWNATDYAQPAANIIRGMGVPEKTDRRYMSAEEIQYSDKSAGLRQEAMIADKVRRGNVSTSAQQNRANANISSAIKSRDLQNIGASENARADQMAAMNVGIRNQTKQQNLELANRYDDQDLQNKAVKDAYKDQGLFDLGRVAQQQRRDKALDKSQDIMLKSLASNNFQYTGDDGVKYIKDSEGKYVNAKTLKPKANGVGVKR